MEASLHVAHDGTLSVQSNGTVSVAGNAVVTGTLSVSLSSSLLIIGGALNVSGAQLNVIVPVSVPLNVPLTIASSSNVVGSFAQVTISSPDPCYIPSFYSSATSLSVTVAVSPSCGGGSNADRSLSAGQIAGITIGLVAVAVLAMFGLALLVRWRRNRLQAELRADIIRNQKHAMVNL